MTREGGGGGDAPTGAPLCGRLPGITGGCTCSGWVCQRLMVRVSIGAITALLIGRRSRSTFYETTVTPPATPWLVYMIGPVRTGWFGWIGGCQRRYGLLTLVT